MKIASILLTLSLCYPALGTDFYCSPTGKSEGRSPGSPMAWTNALLSTNTIRAGDTLWFRAGTYGVGGSMDYTIALTGVTLRNYNGERATLDGQFPMYGSNVTVWGLEFKNSAFATTRTNVAVYSLYSYPGSGGVNVRNCVFHDTCKFFLTVNSQTDREFYGNIMWAIGDYEPPSYHIRGPALYLQNESNAVYITDNIISKSYTEAIKVYGEDNTLTYTAIAEGFVISGNITYLSYNDGIIADSTHHAIRHVIVTNNIGFCDKQNSFSQTIAGLAEPSEGVNHQHVVYNNNYGVFDAAGYTYVTYFGGWSEFNYSGNTIVNIATDKTENGKSAAVFCFITNKVSVAINNNNYYGFPNTFANGGQFFYGETTAPTRRSWAQWQALGHDASGSFHSNALPTANVVTIRTNKYEPGRSHIVVWNWQSNNTQTVSLANTGLDNGRGYTIQDAQDFYGTPIATGIFSNSSPNVTLTLNRTNVAAILGETTHFRRDVTNHTDKIFNVFVVIPDPTNNIVSHAGGNVRISGNVQSR